MKIRLSIFLTFLTILLVYSSEISFMPNYEMHPDLWHLLIPMFVFYFFLIIELIVVVVIMLKSKDKKYDLLLLLLLGLVSFTFLNNPKSDGVVIAYSIFAV